MGNQSFRKKEKGSPPQLDPVRQAKWRQWSTDRVANASSDISGVDAQLIGRFVQVAIKNELAVMFSYWKASNSLAVKVYGDGDPVTVASTDNIDFATELQAFCDAWE